MGHHHLGLVVPQQPESSRHTSKVERDNSSVRSGGGNQTFLKPRRQRQHLFDTDLLSCKEAAWLAATCRYIHKDENLKERHSEESRKIEKARIEQKARDLLQALLEAPSPESEFEVDDDEPTLDQVWAFMGL